MKSFVRNSLRSVAILMIFILVGFTFAEDTYERKIDIYTEKLDDGVGVGIYVEESEGEDFSCEIILINVETSTGIVSSAPDWGGSPEMEKRKYCGGTVFTDLGSYVFFSAKILLIINDESDNPVPVTVYIPTSKNPKYRWYIFNGERPEFGSVDNEGSSSFFQTHFVSVSEQNDQMCSNGVNHVRGITHMPNLPLGYQTPKNAFENIESELRPTTGASFETLLSEPLRVFKESMQTYNNAALTVDVFSSLTDGCVFPDLINIEDLSDEILTGEIKRIIKPQIDAYFDLSVERDHEGNGVWTIHTIDRHKLIPVSIVIQLRPPNDDENKRVAAVVSEVLNRNSAFNAQLGPEVNVGTFVFPLGDPLADDLASRNLHILANPNLAITDEYQALFADITDLYEEYDIPADLIPFQNQFNCYDILDPEDSFAKIYDSFEFNRLEEEVTLGSGNYVTSYMLQGLSGSTGTGSPFSQTSGALIQPNSRYPFKLSSNTDTPIYWFNETTFDDVVGEIEGAESEITDTPFVIPVYDGNGFELREVNPDDSSQFNITNSYLPRCVPGGSP